MAYVLEAALPDGVAGEEAFVLVDFGGEVVEEGADVFEEMQGHFDGEAADADVGGHHALAADGFEDAEEVFALAEAVEEDGHGADVEGVGAEPDKVGVEALELHEEDADPLGAGWDFELEELFDRERVGKVVAHWREVVDAVGEGGDLGVELGFAGLLDAGVEVADVGGQGDDLLAVDFEDEAEDAVGGGVLGAHVEDHGLVGDRVVAVVVAFAVGDYVFYAGDRVGGEDVGGGADGGEGGAGDEACGLEVGVGAVDLLFGGFGDWAHERAPRGGTRGGRSGGSDRCRGMQKQVPCGNNNKKGKRGFPSGMTNNLCC